MSQVKKLQGGGYPELIGVKNPEFKPLPELKVTSSPRTTSESGSITIDGKKYEATPELIQALASHLSGYGETAAPLAGLTNALEHGANIVYDSISNTITGMDGKWAGIDDRTNNRRRSGASQWRRDWDATFNNDAHRFRKAVQLLSGFRYGNTSAGTTTPEDLKNIYGNRVYFKYKVNNDGSKTYLADDADNLEIGRRLSLWGNYLMGTDEDRKGYSLADWYNPQRVEALKTLYANHPSDWNTVIDNIKKKAQAGQDLNANEIAFLEHFNIGQSADAITQNETNAKANAEEAALKRKFADSGFDYDTWSPYLVWNDNGYWNVTEDAQNVLLSDFGGNGSWWFNDAFKSSKYNPNGVYDFLNGYFIIGDRIYKQSDAKNPNSDLYKILSRTGGFRDLNAGMHHNEANNLIEQLWGNEVGWNAPDSKYYSNWLDPNGNIYYRSRTGDYNWKGKNEGQQLIQYVEANPELADEFGYYTPKFRITDRNGNIDLSAIGPEVIQDLIELPIAQRQPSNFDRHRLWYSDSGNSEFDGRYLLGDAVDDDGNVSGAGFWVNPNDPNSQWLFESSEMARYVPDTDGNAIRIPKEMSNIFEKNSDFINNFQNNPEFRKKFVKVMAGSVGRAGNWSTAGATTNINLWKSLGFNDEQARELTRIARKYSENGLWRMFKSSRGKRRAERMVSKPSLHKDGGTIQKAAIGDMLGSANSVSAAPTQIKTNKPLRDPGTFANFGKDKLQAHDIMELGAVIADAASIGLAFTPASIAAGVTGMAGSTAGFAADISRDGFQGSDLGQYAINLGLDAVSFLPVIGGAAKSAKVIKGLKKAAPIVNRVMKAAALYGIPHAAVESWDAIQSGNFNMRDLRAVVNAIGGAVHMTRAGIKRPVRGQSTTELPNVAVKSGAKEGVAELQLNEEMLKALRKKDATVNSVAESIAKELSKGDTKFTAETVKENWDIDGLFKSRKKFLIAGPDVTKAKRLAAKTKRGKVEWEDASKNPKARNLHKAYEQNLAGDLTRTHEVTSPERFIAEARWRPERGTIYEVNSNGDIVARQGILNEADKALPVPLKKIPGTKLQSTHKIPVITPVTSGIVWERTSDAITSPAEVIPVRQEPQRQNRYTWRPVNQPAFRKKGGKIVKGQGGTPVPLTNWQDGSLLVNEEGDGFVGDIAPAVLIENSFTPYQFNDTPVNLPDIPINIDSQPAIRNSDQVYLDHLLDNITNNVASNLNTSNGGTDGFQSDYPGRFINFDQTPIVNGINAAFAARDSDRQLKNWLNRPRYHMMAPLENAPRYINTGTGNAYRNRANAARLYKANSSDSVINDMLRRQRDQEALNYDLQGSLSDSQEYGQYLNNLENWKRETQLRSTDIANKNRHFDWQHDIEDVQQKNANIAEKSKFRDFLINSNLRWYNDQLATRNQILASNDYNSELVNLEKEYAQQMTEYQEKYKGKLDSYEAREELNMIRAKFRAQLENLKNIGAKYTLSYQFRAPLSAKKGGKVGKDSKVTYTRDPYPELLLQNAKSSSRFVEKLSDSVIRLILQTKPTNVS